MGRTKDEDSRYNALHALPLPRLFADRHGLLHAIDVEAESLFEAVAIAVASFRDDEVSPPEIDGMTEFTVAVYRNPTA